MSNLKISRLNTADADFSTALNQLIAWEMVSNTDVEAKVAEILQQVRICGDKALIEYSNQFDRRNCQSIEQIALPREQLQEALEIDFANSSVNDNNFAQSHVNGQSAKEANFEKKEDTGIFQEADGDRSQEALEILKDKSKAAARTEGDAPWKTLGDNLQPRPRPQYNNREQVLSVMACLLDDEERGSIKDTQLKAALELADGDEALVNEVAHYLAMNVSRKDISWNTELKGANSEVVIKAFDDELTSLCKTILT